MDLKQIEKLMISMGRNGIKRFVIKREGLELELERESAIVQYPPVHYDGGVFSGFSREQRPPSCPPVDGGVPSISPQTIESVERSGDIFVTSPMVGTFYSSPSPDSPPYIKPGDFVTEDTLVCIVEAMKVMNEVKSGVRGTVVEVLLTNGDPVQFGSKLFCIKATE